MWRLVAEITSQDVKLSGACIGCQTMTTTITPPTTIMFNTKSLHVIVQLLRAMAVEKLAQSFIGKQTPKNKALWKEFQMFFCSKNNFYKNKHRKQLICLCSHENRIKQNGIYFVSLISNLLSHPLNCDYMY